MLRSSGVDKLLYDAYLAAFWPVVAILAIISAAKRDVALIRCLSVMVAGQLLIQIWFDWFMPPDWVRQPVEVYLVIYAISAFLVTIFPAGRLCATMGGVFMAGALVCFLRLMFGDSMELDWQFWRSNLLIGWLTFLVMMGAASHEGGRRILDYLRGRLARMANRSHSKSMG